MSQAVEQQGVSTGPKKAPTQGDLTQAASIKAPGPLVDIGANLIDHSFEKVLAAFIRGLCCLHACCVPSGQA